MTKHLIARFWRKSLSGTSLVAVRSLAQSSSSSSATWNSCAPVWPMPVTAACTDQTHPQWPHFPAIILRDAIRAATKLVSLRQAKIGLHGSNLGQCGSLELLGSLLECLTRFAPSISASQQPNVDVWRAQLQTSEQRLRCENWPLSMTKPQMPNSTASFDPSR